MEFSREHEALTGPDRLDCVFCCCESLLKQEGNPSPVLVPGVIGKGISALMSDFPPKTLSTMCQT